MPSPAAFGLMETPFATSACSLPDVASAVSVHVKDASKRKRVNRNAKLKQCKLDARREQWLSQVKHGKGYQRETNPHLHLVDNLNKADPGELVHPGNTSCETEEVQSKNSEKLECVSSRSSFLIQRSDSQQEEASRKQNVDCLSCVSDISEAGSSPKSFDCDSPKSKLIRWGKDCLLDTTSCERAFEEECNKTDFVSKTSESLAANNTDYFSFLKVSHKNNDDGLESVDDDWETAADALELNISQEHSSSICEMQLTSEMQSSLQLQSMSVTEQLRPVTHGNTLHGTMSRSKSSRAWRPDDALRPSSLPTLSKQQSLPVHHVCQKQQQPSIQSLFEESNSPPSLCPICAEELDNTDSSFEPCACGFRMCLFCHHRIAADDGRCPGCRKFYNRSSVDKSVSLC